MTFASLLAAVILEHYRPLTQPLPYYRAYARYAGFLREKIDGGEPLHGVLAWIAAVLPLLLVTGLIYGWFNYMGSVLGWAVNVAVLYFTAGFKYYSRVAEEIAGLIKAGQMEQACRRLEIWRGDKPNSLQEEDAIRLTLEELFSRSHRQMFGVFFWFTLLSPFGPVGAVLFRSSSILARRWNGNGSAFGRFAETIFQILNWLPARLTAGTYAVAGNFEDAMYCWRSQGQDWRDPQEGMILAAGAGAMGVRLGLPVCIEGEWLPRPELGINQNPDADHIDNAISLIWRGLVIWMVVGLLLFVAGWAS
ncbi:MAG: CobD/CbiB family protein [Thiobacillaceae bacterium]|jgi:adenosylcobinamide-phosphate synthase